MPSIVDRALPDDVRREQRRKLDGEPERIALRPDVLDRAGRVDVPLDEMAAQARVGAQRALEIDQDAAAQARRAR